MTITALNSGPAFTRLSDFPWFPDDPNMNIMAIRAHAQNNSRATDVGEVLRALTGLKSGDGEGWHNRFRNLAEAVRAQAEKAEKENHLVTARQSYLRASTYFRMSTTFIERGARTRAMYGQQLECFTRFAALSDPPIERVQIPYDGITMNGWYMPPKKKTGPKNAAYIYCSSEAGACEGTIQTSPTEAVERGLGVLLCDGPGSGATLMIHRKVGTPEYEKPFKAMVDYLVSRPDIDPNRIGVAGSDFGAYNAVRAAVFEKRVKCCGVITACYDALVDLYDYGQEGHRHGLPAFLGEDPNNVEAVREKLKAYTLKGVADKLTVPLLILQGEENVNYPIEPAYRLYADAKGPKELRIVNADHHTGHRRMEVLAGLTDWFVDHLK